ncbi:glycosyltransferase family 2 protein [Polynucleobacter sp. MG-6-Vaara-E2]|uniref:glycosyltransferase family 2 protein n=1 Tax=Polynucleobacter sp. MG-6-Vaara-E2 TaxID=2576932 RepID=UPI001BFDD3FA|nr:glycosyltransferase family 2 protein [Polynucleobacter sp. MG-6-Vaara-E2]QWD96838.1 glycosyltransferase family 2 protein [Polynucleobacter sp. MG-6-Vaara-E2]
MPHSVSNPLISVLMPAFNVEDYVGPAIESILNQTYTNFELIVLDDGSSDGTVKIISTYSDPRLKKVFLPENKGLVSARNTLVGMAQGKYIAFLDSDDLSDPRRLELQLQYLQSNHLDLCGTDHIVLHQGSGKLKFSKQRHSDADIRAMIAVCSPLCNPSVMGRAEVFSVVPYLSGNDGAEDYVMWVNLALAGCKFGNVPKNLITYRVHDNQISKVQNAKVTNIFDKRRKQYLNALGISDILIPRRLPLKERLSLAPRFLFALNKKIPGISISANYQIYSRYQFRGNGIWTPFTRLERVIVAAVASICGALTS